VVLSLDPATNTGWVLTRYTSGEQPLVFNHGTYEMKQHRFEGGGMRHLRFRRWLTELLHDAQPELVVFEEVPSHRGVHAAHLYGGITTNIMQTCDELGFTYAGVPVGTWKRLGIGAGNASKDVVRQVFLTLETTIHDAASWTQDEIDAYYIGSAAATELGWGP
jgi:Holliday junction resolvasome RuvABC endonuclease subunit